jgi:hypothetical protein
MAGTSMPTDTPPPRVLDRAAHAGLGKFQQRVRRRPGIGGATACCAILIVIINLAVHVPKDGWARGLGVLGLLIIITWGYVWFHRTRGGLYMFSQGFIDAAGRRLIVVEWSQIRSVKGQKTQFLIGSFPVGSAFTYEVGYVARASDLNVVRPLNTTYADIHSLARLIARRSGVPVTGITDPYRM